MTKEITDKHFIQRPVYVGGQDAMKKFIRENLKYPDAALKDKVEGAVWLRYSIDHKGFVKNAKIISSLSKECDQEAIRVVKLLKFEVAKQYKANVLFHKKIRVNFNLPRTGQNLSFNYTLVQSKSIKKKVSDPTKTSFHYTIRTT